MGRYPTKAKLCPFNPEAITDKRIDEGPTKGTTGIFLRCAISTISAPGSATPGVPASEIIPIFLDFDSFSAKNPLQSYFLTNLQGF